MPFQAWLLAAVVADGDIQTLLQMVNPVDARLILDSFFYHGYLDCSNNVVCTAVFLCTTSIHSYKMDVRHTHMVCRKMGT